MFKELITKVFTIVLILGALHATAGSINPEKVDSEEKKTTVVVEADSTEKSSESSTAALDRLSDKAAKKVSSVTENDDEVSGSESSTSIVSFNFVYYLLEKFKFSDLLGR
jgi:hypothetical protein